MIKFIALLELHVVRFIALIAISCITIDFFNWNFELFLLSSKS